MPGTAQLDGLFIATPERVSFSYQLAGLGTRFTAQVVDTLLLGVATTVVFVGAAAIGLGGNAATLVMVIGLFLLVNGYFVFFEGLWSGQTPGKRLARLRVVAEAGQPITFEQALMRNLVRNVDWLPFLYGVGIIALFAGGGGKRLGDLAAGTVVVRERAGLSLPRLLAASQRVMDQATLEAASGSAPVTAESAYLRQRTIRDLEPALRDLVVAYAGRRHLLPPGHREALAQSARAGLARALPAVVEERGALAALDQLADYVAAG